MFFFPFVGGVGGNASSNAQPTDAKQGSEVVAPGMPLMLPVPAPVIEIMQMQINMQMQFLSQMQAYLSQLQQGDATQQDGATQLPFNMSMMDLQKLLQIDASPKALDMLQQALDFVFDAYEKQG